MYDIFDCVDSFEKMLDIKYYLILGRKGRQVHLIVKFNKNDCFHLMGLQYLKDRPQLKRDRGKIFDEIRLRNIDKRVIESSDYYNQIENRINFLPHLEELFDSNETVFKYNKKLNNYSMIEADYLMKNQWKEKNIFIFLSKRLENEYFCRSFFLQGKVNEIIQEIRLLGLCYLRKKLKFPRKKKKFYMID